MMSSSILLPHSRREKERGVEDGQTEVTDWVAVREAGGEAADVLPSVVEDDLGVEGCTPG